MSLTPTIDAPDSLNEINDLFYRMGMTDGLPIIPPTPERVEEMLQGTSRDPNEVVATIPPKQGEATVEKIAINAAMAGCVPAFLPVITSAIEAVVEEGFNLFGAQTTTNPVTPALVINGPIAKKLGVNGGYNCLGEGSRANATIGRALRLALLNIGGARPGEISHTTQGQPGRYAFCFAENEEESPWPPLHTDLGFHPTQSTVTAFGAGGTTNIRPWAHDGPTVLAALARLMASGGSPRLNSHALLVLSPELARIIANDGYSKEDTRRYLFENARFRPSGFTSPVQQGILDEPVMAFMDPRRFIGEIGPDTLVYWAQKPEDIIIVVAGGAGGHAVFIPGTFHQLTPAVTKLIR